MNSSNAPPSLLLPTSASSPMIPAACLSPSNGNAYIPPIHQMVESLVLRQGGVESAPSTPRGHAPHIRTTIGSPSSVSCYDVRRRAVTLSCRIPPPPPISNSTDSPKASTSPSLASSSSTGTSPSAIYASRHLSMQKGMNPLSLSSPIASPTPRPRAKTTVSTTTKTENGVTTTITTIVSTTIPEEKLTDRIPPPPPLSASSTISAPSLSASSTISAPSLSASSTISNPSTPLSNSSTPLRATVGSSTPLSPVMVTSPPLVLSPARTRSPSLNALANKNSPALSVVAPLSPIYLGSSAGLLSPSASRALSPTHDTFLPTVGNQVNKSRVRSISSPYNVLKHSGGITSSTDSIVNEQVPEEPYTHPLANKKQGYLYKLAGVIFRRRWFEIDQHIVSYYKKQGARSPRGQIELVDSKFQKISLPNRPYTIHLFSADKKQYYISCDDKQELAQWVSAFQRGGSIDKDFLKREEADKIARNKEEQREKEKERRKAETDYIQKVRKEADRTDIISDSSVDMTNDEITMSECFFNVVPSNVSDVDIYGRKLFRIEVIFEAQRWVILRTYEKISHLYRETNMLLPVPLILPPNQADKGLNAAHFQANQLILLQRFMETLGDHRESLLRTFSGKRAFLKFIAPVCWQDEKPVPFQMPFQVPVMDDDF